MIGVYRSGPGFALKVHGLRSAHEISAMDAVNLRDSLNKALSELDKGEAPLSMEDVPAEARTVLERVAASHGLSAPDLLSRTRQWKAARAEAVLGVRAVMKPKGWNSDNISWLFSREGSTMRGFVMREKRRVVKISNDPGHDGQARAGDQAQGPVGASGG